jgi:hypothetical protein
MDISFSKLTSKYDNELVSGAIYGISKDGSYSWRVTLTHLEIFDLHSGIRSCYAEFQVKFFKT